MKQIGNGLKVFIRQVGIEGLLQRGPCDRVFRSRINSVRALCVPGTSFH
jgi:hypothetical protein